MKIHESAVQLDLFMLSAESKLYTLGAIPIVGSFFGMTRLVLGIAQTISALVIGIFAMFPAIFGNKSAQELCDHCFSHFKHGLFNTAAGFIDTIPIVGSFCKLVAAATVKFFHWCTKPETQPKVRFNNGQENQYYAYSEIFDETGHIEYRDENGTLSKISYKDAKAKGLIDEQFHLTKNNKINPTELQPVV